MREGLQPIAIAEADPAFSLLLPYARLVVAVSGGADSLALLHLIADWRDRGPVSSQETMVVTVDHALRPGSAEEAKCVGEAAAQRGLRHVTAMRNEPRPDGPFSQAWARALRYRMLQDIALRDLPGGARAAIVTAHHSDDQAETLLMRLGRGSGLEGLAAMRSVRPLDDPRVDLVRPMLGFGKGRLVATLAARGIAWRDDPSNDDDRFERVRLRQNEAARSSLGLGGEALARSAYRLARADVAVEAITASVLADPRIVQGHAFGYATIHWPALLLVPAEVRLRVLARLMDAIGADGSGERVALGALEAMTEASGWRRPDGHTLHRCAFVADGTEALSLVPERGRLGRRAVGMAGRLVWGGFDMTIGSVPPGSQIGALERDGLELLGSRGLALPPIPRPSLLAQPALFDASGGLIAAPTLGLGSEAITVSARVLNVTRASSSRC